MDIKKRIKECGFTLEDVAAKLKNTKDGSLGISQPSMSSIVNGNTTFSRLQEIANIIGISVSELVADGDSIRSTIVCPECGARLKIVKDTEQ